MPKPKEPKLESHKTEKHAHTECKHCAHICRQCDAAYCCKCPKEWRNCFLFHNTTVGSAWTSTPSGLLTNVVSPISSCVPHAHGH